MTKDELERYLDQLGLTQTDAARLLSVTPRTVRRWLDEDDIPGPVAETLRAWACLHKNHLPWGPNSVAVAEDDMEKIAEARADATGLAAMIAKVEFRGGARLPWKVNLEGRNAELGAMRIDFYVIKNGTFALSRYTRSDQMPDVTRDREFIEDAAWCIERALRSF